jgi:hypothetical protein
VHDPLEGVAADGTIETGVGRGPVPAAFAPVVDAAVEAVRAAAPGAALFLYGSVATGRARPGTSDVDLIGFGLPGATATAIGAELSDRFAGTCRGVELAPSDPADLAGDSDEAYGNRVFLRHYCLQLSGPPRTDLDTAFPADARAARGFNGDLAVHADRWRQALADGADPIALARRVARKSLVAAAGLVSVHDRTWTTDRARGARGWAELDPDRAGAAAQLLSWVESAAGATRPQVADLLDGAVPALVASFAELVGLWPRP